MMATSLKHIVADQAHIYTLSAYRDRIAVDNVDISRLDRLNIWRDRNGIAARHWARKEIPKGGKKGGMDLLQLIKYMCF